MYIPFSISSESLNFTGDVMLMPVTRSSDPRSSSGGGWHVAVSLPDMTELFGLLNLSMVNSYYISRTYTKSLYISHAASNCYGTGIEII